MAALRLQADASPKQGQTEARLDDALKEALASKQRADAAERARNAIEKESEGKVLAERQRADEAEGKAAELARRVQEAHAEVEAYKERIATAEQEVYPIAYARYLCRCDASRDRRREGTLYVFCLVFLSLSL